jgi:hypothetical protein
MPKRQDKQTAVVSKGHIRIHNMQLWDPLPESCRGSSIGLLEEPETWIRPIC